MASQPNNDNDNFALLHEMSFARGSPGDSKTTRLNPEATSFPEIIAGSSKTVVDTGVMDDQQGLPASPMTPVDNSLHGPSMLAKFGFIRSTGPLSLRGSSSTSELTNSTSSHSARDFASPGRESPIPELPEFDCNDASPLALRLGPSTAPRNYAPRTSGLPAIPEPPPKFLLPIGRPKLLETSKDPFGSGLLASPWPRNQHVKFSPSCSEKLRMLTGTPCGKPALATAMSPNNFPFSDTARTSRLQNHGVVKLTNIPYDSKINEIIALMGRNSRILPDSEEPVHIIMERTTGKTMDAYIEFSDLEDAMRAVQRHEERRAEGRHDRLGTRSVDIRLSSQGQLMADLFPAAKGVEWKGTTPEFLSVKPLEPWDNFKFFIAEEEMTLLIKYVESPERYAFSKGSFQRPFECMISTLRKFPWSCTDRVTIAQRQSMFRVIMTMLDALLHYVEAEKDPKGNWVSDMTRKRLATPGFMDDLNGKLVRRLAMAALSCPGFTVFMKNDIVMLLGYDEDIRTQFHVPRLAGSWRHQLALGCKPGMPQDVIEWYISIIREQTILDVLSRPLAERSDLLERGCHTDPYWGYFWAELGYVFGPDFDNMTLARAAVRELTAIENVLTRALARY